MPLKYRVLTIIGLCLVSVWFLFPRNVTRRERRPDGTLQDVTVRTVPLQRGLDLKGGTYLALEVDDSKQSIPADKKGEAIDRALKTVRTRIEGFGVSEVVVQKQGTDRIVVQIPGIQDPERARKLVEETAFLAVQDHRQDAGARASAAEARRGDQAARSRRKERHDRRKGSVRGEQGSSGFAYDDGHVEESGHVEEGVAAAKDSANAADSLKLQPGGAFSSLLEQGQMPGEFYVDVSKIPALENYLADSAVRAAMPPGKDFNPGTDSSLLQGKWYRTYYLVDSKPIITGDYLTKARPNHEPGRDHRRVRADQRRRPAIRRRDGQARARLHGDHPRRPSDGSSAGHQQRHPHARPDHDGWQGSRGRSGSRARAQCRRASREASRRAGAEHRPEPRTGFDRQGRSRGHHRRRARRDHHDCLLPVLRIARGGRIWCCTCSTRLRRSPDSTPCSRCRGSPGFVLSIGIAVDANVLIFERIREELDRGKTVRTAIDEGFRHAMPAIVDSNVSTILTAAVLYQYGTGPVQRLRGHAHRRYLRFARHLDLRGADLLSPVAQPLARRPDAEHLMLRILHDTKYDFIKYWRHAVAATVAFIVLGMALMGYHKARTGRRGELQHRVHGRRVDSTAVHRKRRRRADAVRSAVDRAGFAGRSDRGVRFGERATTWCKVPPKSGAACAEATPTASARRSSRCSSRRSRRIQRRSRKAEGVGAQRRRRVEDEGVHRHSHLVRRHAHLSRVPVRVALRRRGRRRDGARHPHDAWRSSP